MNKKAIAILGAIFLLIVGTLGYLIYANSHKKTSSQTTDNPVAGLSPISTSTNIIQTSIPLNTTPNTTSPFVKLGDSQVVSPTQFYNGQGITYFDSTGHLFQADLTSSADILQLSRLRNLDIKTKGNISRVLWPAKGDDFIVEFNQAGQKTWSYFNSKTGEYTDFPAQIIAVDWMPSGDKIMYVWLEKGKASLNLSSPDTKNWKEISVLFETDDDIKISPDAKNIAFYRTGNTGLANALNLTTPDGKIWKGLVKDGFNTGAVWSPDSQKILFLQKDPSTQKNLLWYVNVATDETKSLGVVTSMDKVAWSPDSKTAYASVPVSDNGSGDKIVSIDPQTLTKKEYAAPTGQLISAQNLFLNLTGDKLFFKNIQDGLLYYVDVSR